MTMSPHSGRSWAWLALCLVAAPLIVNAQSRMTGSGPGALVRIFNSDSAVLEAREERKELPCQVSPIKPLLGFDLRFHAGYEVTIPLRELAGGEDLLTMIFRVSPENRRDDPVYFSQRITVPTIEEDAKGLAYLEGSFDLGEGKYHVDWLMRDRSERVCSSFWEVDAALPGRDRDLQLALAPGEIDGSDREPFEDEPPIKRIETDEPLNIKVMVNFAPQNTYSATLRPLDLNALVSILRNIAREPRITKFSVVAFNMQDQRVVYRQEQDDRIDFPALGQSLNSLRLGTVDIRKLEDKQGDTHFLADLIGKEMAGEDNPDAVIFAGPKVMLDEKLPEESLKRLGELNYPVFYMNYILSPQANPWRDAIGTAVRYLKGAEYTISRPRDLFFAWSEIMARIVKLKAGRHPDAASR
jgi:hypothetical protein